MGIKELIQKALGYRLGTPTNVLGLTEMKVPPGWGYQSYLQAYGQVGWLFACVNIIANAVARQPWHLYKIDSTGDRDEITEHSLLDLMDSLNPFQTRYQFFYLGTMYKKLVGEEFWQINFNNKGQPAELWLAPPAYMNVIPSSSKYIDHYEFQRPGMSQGVNFDTDEIIHIMTPNPYNPYRGLSEAQALTTDIDSERYAAKYQQKLFFNEGVPGFIVKYPAADMPNSESRKELVQEWDERFKGFRNRGKTAFLWGGEPSTITLSNRDMDFATLRNFDRDLILGAYGVPKSVLGLTETSTFASAKAGNYSFAFYVIHPELCAIREAINKELVPFFGDHLYLDFENPVPEDETMSANNAANLYKSGLVKLNEGRKMVGLDPIDEPEGEEFYKAPPPVNPFGGNPQNPADNSPENETPVDEDKKGLKKKLFESEELKEAYWKGYINQAESYEAAVITELREKLFNVQRDEAVAKLKADPDADSIADYTELIDLEKNKQLYTDVMLPILTRCMDAAIRYGRDLIEPENPHKTKDEGIILPVINQQALEWLKTRISWAADEIGEESASRLNAILADGFEQGLGTDAIAEKIRDEFDNYFSQNRATMISRTETISASAQGTLEGYKESGVVSKVQFYTAMDERTCEYCNEYHNQVYKIGDQMPIPLHPNCLLPDVRVEASHIIAGNRAFYRGDAIEITTENGNILSCTPNHPILGLNGFIKAKLLNEGDYVISSLDSQRIIGSIDPYNNNGPAFIEDVWNSLRMKDGMFVGSMPVTSHDFYGDARMFDGNIDIIHTNSFLRGDIDNPFFFKHLSEKHLCARHARMFGLSGEGSQFSLSNSLISPFSSDMRSGGPGLALLDRHSSHRNDISLTAIAGGNTSTKQSALDSSAIYPELSRQFKSRFSSLITHDKIVNIRKFNYIGHVYDLQSLEQLYIANNIVVKNCRCVWLPVIE